MNDGALAVSTTERAAAPIAKLLATEKTATCHVGGDNDSHQLQQTAH
jgi:hypothetical protein